MKYEGHIKIYSGMVIAASKKVVLPRANDKNDEFGKSLKNIVLGVEDKSKEEKKFSPYEHFISNKLFRPFNEISCSVESIENISIYVKTFPYSRYGVSKVSHLKYHVENYLNELYIFKNRLISYLKAIDRSYSKSSIAKHVTETIFPLYSFVSKSMKNYVVVRGNHVHQNRYSDSEITRLSLLELLSLEQNEPDKIIMRIYSDTYKETRKKWTERISNAIEKIHTILDIYFKILIKAISKNGVILIPDNFETPQS